MVGIYDEFGETLGDLCEKIQDPENSSFEDLRLIFKEIARIFFNVTENNNNDKRVYIKKTHSFLV